MSLFPRTASILFGVIAVFASAQAAETGVAGTVSVGPTCLGPQREVSCVSRYSSARVVVRDATGAVEQRADADSDGNFRLTLPTPGSYQVAVEGQGGVWPRCPSASADVHVGETTRVDITCDSGAR